MRCRRLSPMLPSARAASRAVLILALSLATVCWLVAPQQSGKMYAGEQLSAVVEGRVAGCEHFAFLRL